MSPRPQNHLSQTDPDHEDHEDNEITQMLPSLYSKRVIFMFCLLLSTIFGAVILMSNLNVVKEKKGKWQVLLFTILYGAGQAYTVINFTTSYIGLLLNLTGAIILTEYFWNRYIGGERDFVKKSWKKPALVSALIIVPLMIAMFLSAS